MTRATLRSRLRRYRPWWIGASVLAALSLWLAFQHKPGWYRPVEVTEEVVQRARRDAPNLIDTISDQLVRGEPVDITLNERDVNEWLAALPQVWPDAWAEVPPELSKPAVKFTEKGVFVGAHVSKSGWEVIFGVKLRLSVVDVGQSIEIGLDSVRAGSLPVPALLIKPMLNRALAQQGRSADAGAFDGSLSNSPIRSADDLFSGIRVENRFEWPNGRRWFTIDRLELSDGRATMRLTPESTGNRRSNKVRRSDHRP